MKGCDYIMIKMKWVITDNLSGVSLDEFENEWNGIISGYFEININQSQEGFCPPKKTNKVEEGMEDVLYWLNHLSEGLNMIKKGKEYEMILLTMNLYKIVMRLDDEMCISFVNKRDNMIKWEERVDIQEFQNELSENVEKFLQIIRETNPQLLNSKWIKKLSA